VKETTGFGLLSCYNTLINIISIHYIHNKIYEKNLKMKYMCEYMETEYRHDKNRNKLSQ